MKCEKIEAYFNGEASDKRLSSIGKSFNKKSAMSGDVPNTVETHLNIRFGHFHFRGCVAIKD